MAESRGSALQVKAFPLKTEFMNIMSHNAFISAMAFLLLLVLFVDDSQTLYEEVVIEDYITFAQRHHKL